MLVLLFSTAQFHERAQAAGAYTDVSLRRSGRVSHNEGGSERTWGTVLRTEAELEFQCVRSAQVSYWLRRM